MYNNITHNFFSLSLLSGILALGFDDKFIRTWEYYFLYCAAAFKGQTAGECQVYTHYICVHVYICNPIYILHVLTVILYFLSVCTACRLCSLVRETINQPVIDD